MKLRLPLLLLVLIGIATPSARAARPFLCCDHNGDKVCVVSFDACRLSGTTLRCGR